ESTSTNKFDRVQWYGMRGRIPKHKNSYEDVTVIALYVRGGDKLSAQSQNQVSVIGTRKLPVLADGEWTSPVATRDIVPWVNYVMKSAGGTDDDMDVDELARYGSIWSGRGDYFDYAVDDDSTVKECINDALLAGFAEFTLERGQVTPVRDELRTQIGHMYTPQNMTEPLKRGFTLPAPDDYDGVDIKYVDEVSHATETVRCGLPGDLGMRVQTVTLKGVTNRDKAWRIGRRMRRAQIYRNKSYNFSTELDALNSGYLSYDAVADDIPGYGTTAILEDFTSGVGPVILTSSEDFTWKSGASHVVALRRPDGTLSGPWAASRVDDFRLAIPALDFEPDLSWDIEPPHLLFGESTRWCYPVLITSIDPGDHSADVEAVNYDPRVYADDDKFADN
ncbi:host specificity factor TipJ family phage tail protein, partial [Pseudomonas umsongensis]|uniref:host specificity factor TipJ family phage tail protein n=1 Tax=Pseudomonas umsongensis TaxID=198618 RepID=UPI00200B7379